MATTVRAHAALAETALLPPGFTVPASRWTDPATRLRQLLQSEPYVFAPGIYDPHGADIADQVLPKRCGHIAGKALISADEMIGKLRMARAVAEDLGRDDFVVIARTDAVSAVDAPERTRGLDLAIERALRYLDSGAPDLVWCEFPNSDREPTERFADQVRRRFPDAKLAFNWSSSFKWFNHS